MGINALHAFLHHDKPDVETVVDQIEHVADITGTEHVGLGFDFYEYKLEYMSPMEREYMIDVSTASGLHDDADITNLMPALLDRGFESEDVRKILKAKLRTRLQTRSSVICVELHDTSHCPAVRSFPFSSGNLLF